MGRTRFPCFADHLLSVLFIDLTHTSHTQACTGIQRVCRSISRSLADQEQVLHLCHDPYWSEWRRLDRRESTTVSKPGVASSRGARWPWHARLRGHLGRKFSRKPEPLPPAGGLIVPEVFSPVVAAALPRLFSLVQGPRVALFHDAIALQLPEISPAKTVTRFPSYLRELTMFDGIAAVSEFSRASLLEYWKWAGFRNIPAVVALPLGLDSAPSAVDSENAISPIPTILSVGTIEGRKNHVALLDASEQLWSRGFQFELHLVGTSHPQTGRQAMKRMQWLQAAGRRVRYDGPVSEPALHQAYRQCAFTVYASLVEGFGLPVLESLSHGKPCICSSQNALGESARGGGCLTVGTPDAASLADAMARLLQDPSEIRRLTLQAGARTFKSWETYASELRTWLNTLSPQS